MCAGGAQARVLGNEGIMTKPPEQTHNKATVQRIEFLLDQMGRAFAADLAVAELERRAALHEKAGPCLFESVTDTRRPPPKLGAK